ncbi:sugar ABC transporter substrate-binding protein [Boudabousia liubingyangii]|uniref:Sugar ABC transporter substrate-binding protein n=1 Tax=Boudabousia liubingyangii TaxID=1921764 RepID=A0A1Q5PQ15_9ACTO|nr:extracellular solute-binding protein [Boudabousia liubingyangii]OKL49540.1 sugar ABC transporter substrate-binding protein [Boudabousia liubingyangii]
MKKTQLLGAMLAFSLAGTLTACSGTNGSGSGSSGAADKNVRVWFMEGSISEDAQKYLKEEFEKQNPGAKLTVEIQPWPGIVAKLQTSLASKTESPDLVETGNTQSATFTTVGAFADVTNLKEKLGGKDLIPSFVDATTVNGKIYGYPLYAGARGVYYRKDLFQKAGIEVPQTIGDFKNAVIKLQEANPEGVEGFSGMYLAAVDGHGVESVLFADGFDYAKLENGKWKSLVTSPESMEALNMLKDLFEKGTKYGLDSQAGQKSFERNFNDGKTGVLVGTGNIGVKIDKKLWDEGKVGVFALPSKTPGVAGATFAGGSNISMAKNAQNPELAAKALEVIFSKGFQELIAKDGWVPGNLKYADSVSGPFGEISQQIVANTKLTPNTPQWGVAADDGAVNDFFTRIAKGEDLQKTANDFSQMLEKELNSGN